MYYFGGAFTIQTNSTCSERFSDGVLGCGDMNEIDADQCQIRSDDHVIEQASMNSVKIIEFVFL